jgi:hypothetical protein
VTGLAGILPNVSLEQPQSNACCPIFLTELGRSHVKKFHINILLYNAVERVVLTNQGTNVLLVGLISQ